jgi:hypothetical protein
MSGDQTGSCQQTAIKHPEKRMMKRVAVIWIFIFIFLFVQSSCQTGGCPNCVNPKPEYYNSAKAKEVRRIMRQNKSITATGSVINEGQDAKEKKSGRSFTRNRDKQKPIIK